MSPHSILARDQGTHRPDAWSTAGWRTGAELVSRWAGSSSNQWCFAQKSFCPPSPVHPVSNRERRPADMPAVEVADDGQKCVDMETRTPAVLAKRIM